MTSQSRKHRGYRTQDLAAGWFAKHGWPYAQSTGAGRSGVDITGMPGLAPEVKARTNFNLTGFLKQAAANAGEALSFVLMRPNGYGPERIGQWAVILTLEDFTVLLQDAGYGGLDIDDTKTKVDFEKKVVDG